MRKAFIFSIVFAIIFFPQPAYSDSSYTLPYPSEMPGNKMYFINRLYEEVSKYVYFGNLGQFTYALKYSDKYLVEAKTLFEYEQYFLAYHALIKSNSYFKNVRPLLNAAQKEGKNITEKDRIFHQASQKHIEILKKIEEQSPVEFYWSPEKTLATKLEIKKMLDEAIRLRKNI